MSLCRWSTDDFNCDLYVYNSGNDQYTIHVAGNRVVGNVPKITSDYMDAGDPKDMVRCKEWISQYDAQINWLINCERENITLKYAGESFTLSGEMAIAKLHELKALGYKFPNYVITDIEDELAEEETDD